MFTHKETTYCCASYGKIREAMVCTVLQNSKSRKVEHIKKYSIPGCREVKVLAVVSGCSAAAGKDDSVGAT